MQVPEVFETYLGEAHGARRAKLVITRKNQPSDRRCQEQPFHQVANGSCMLACEVQKLFLLLTLALGTEEVPREERSGSIGIL